MPLSLLHAGHPRKFHQLKNSKPCQLPAWAKRTTRSENFVDVTARYQTVQNPNMCCYGIKIKLLLLHGQAVGSVGPEKVYPSSLDTIPATLDMNDKSDVEPEATCVFVTYCRQIWFRSGFYSLLYAISQQHLSSVRLQARVSQKANILHHQFPLRSLLMMMMHIMSVVMAMKGCPMTLPQLVLAMMFLILCFMLLSSGPEFFQTCSPPRYYLPFCLGVGCERALCPACPCPGWGVFCPWSEGGSS